MPLHADEAIRGTVAHEMMVNDNYIVPTISNEYYYKKPPVYNWVLVGTFLTTQSFSEFVFRLPSVIPLFIFGLSIFQSSRIYLGNRVGVLAGFLFMLMGSIITRDSMLGHIDIFFSWITFLQFFFIFYFYSKRQYYLLFVISYILAAIGVLSKGLPSFLFQGLTLLAWFIYKKEFKKLLGIHHIIGLTIFALLVVGYFIIYSNYNSLIPYFEALYDQSSQRTFTEKSWIDSIKHLFIFPFENIFVHMMPSSLVFMFCLKKGLFKKWMQNDFLAFLLLTFAINIIPYWLSPGYYPRYLYMLYPLLFILGALAYYQNRSKLKYINRAFELIFLILGIALTTAFLYPLMEEMDFVQFSNIKSIGLFLAGVLVLFAFVKLKAHRIYISLVFVLLFRIGFDFFVIPYRVFVDPNEVTKQRLYAERIVELSGSQNIYLYKKTPIKYEYNYYIGTAKNAVLDRIFEIEDYDALYIAHDNFLDDKEYELVYEFYQDYELKPKLKLVKFRE